MIELEKNGLNLEILEKLSFESTLERNLKNNLHKFSKDTLFNEIISVIRFYENNEILDDIAADYRIKSLDSCLRKYDKYYPNMTVEKVFNDILGFRIITDDYEPIFGDELPEHIRIVDIRNGKAVDDGYRGIHLYYQKSHKYYPIEIQINSYYDRQLNNWLHKYLYKYDYGNEVGKELRISYESGQIRNEREFEEALKRVLFNSKKI